MRHLEYTYFASDNNEYLIRANVNFEEEGDYLNTKFSNIKIYDEDGRYVTQKLERELREEILENMHEYIN